MLFICEKKSAVLIILIIIYNLKSLQSTDLKVKDICQLSNERYPDKEHRVSDILHSYEMCLQTLGKYSGLTKEQLVNQLINNLECFKDDLKQSYYAGNVKYRDVELVENMETEMRNIGIDHGIFQTSKNKCNFARMTRSTIKHIIPLVVTGTTSEKKKACDALFKRDKGGNISLLDIPTPKLDSNKEPRELTVPLTRPHPCRVDSPEAENALTQYYKVIMQCLTLTTEHKIQVFKFNKRFYEWLTTAVLPHLKDDKCYPAFGGVLRIVETMRQNDFVPKNATANFMFYRQRGLEKKEEEHRKKQDSISKIIFSYTFLLIVVPLCLVIAICFFFLVWRNGCSVCWCCRKKDDSDSSSTEVFYYPIEETPSVSLDLDDVSSDPPSTQRSDVNSTKKKRQRGGEDAYVYSMTYSQDDMLMSLPLKRQWLSNSSSGVNELQSPGKRQKIIVDKYLK